GRQADHGEAERRVQTEGTSRQPRPLPAYDFGGIGNVDEEVSRSREPLDPQPPDLSPQNDVVLVLPEEVLEADVIEEQGRSLPCTGDPHCPQRDEDQTQEP